MASYLLVDFWCSRVGITAQIAGVTVRFYGYCVNYYAVHFYFPEDGSRHRWKSRLSKDSAAPEHAVTWLPGACAFSPPAGYEGCSLLALVGCWFGSGWAGGCGRTLGARLAAGEGGVHHLG